MKNNETGRQGKGGLERGDKEKKSKPKGRRVANAPAEKAVDSFSLFWRFLDLVSVFFRDIQNIPSL